MIRKIEISNFRLFSADEAFLIDALNVPDGTNEGSGLNIFVGENGCGKSTLLDALALPYVSYKADSFSLNDMNDPDKETNICVYTDESFDYKGTMPNKDYIGQGFNFKAGKRKVGSKVFATSTIVTDQQFIRAEGEELPKDNTPDIRLSVNNPWTGPRYRELEYLILDKNRTFQTRSGTYNDTRFDKIMEDFNFQYLKHDEHPIDCNEKVKEVKQFNKGVAESIFQAIGTFADLSGYDLKLQVIDNWKPFSSGFFAVEKENLQSIPLSELGAGYEMMFSLLYAYHLSKRENKKLIILIDEPELHLHPRLQHEFIKLLHGFSVDSQIVITTHSPLFIKQAMGNQRVNVKVLTKSDGTIQVAPPEKSVLPYSSANEVNYIAFNLPTEEYHNELFGRLQELSGRWQISDFDDYLSINGLDKDYTWTAERNGKAQNTYKATLCTFIRHKIHHPENQTMSSVNYTETDLRDSINSMMEIIAGFNEKVE